jgi:hypothetical protein
MDKDTLFGFLDSTTTQYGGHGKEDGDLPGTDFQVMLAFSFT